MYMLAQLAFALLAAVVRYLAVMMNVMEIYGNLGYLARRTKHLGGIAGSVVAVGINCAMYAGGGGNQQLICQEDNLIVKGERREILVTRSAIGIGVIVALYLITILADQWLNGVKGRVIKGMRLGWYAILKLLFVLITAVFFIIGVIILTLTSPFNYLNIGLAIERFHITFIIIISIILTIRDNFTKKDRSFSRSWLKEEQEEEHTNILEINPQELQLVLEKKQPTFAQSKSIKREA